MAVSDANPLGSAGRGPAECGDQCVRGWNRPPDRRTRRDLRTLARFIDVYCRHQHEHAERAPVELKTHSVEHVTGRPVPLCSECTKLLAHAFVKRTTCPMDPKPNCKHCPEHCYHPRYRAAIREVMRYSGRKLVMSGRLDYLIHLLF